VPRVKRALPDRGDVGPLEDGGRVANGVWARHNDVRVQHPDVVDLVARCDHELASGEPRDALAERGPVVALTRIEDHRDQARVLDRAEKLP
jgi:hypothetical protein